MRLECRGQRFFPLRFFMRWRTRRSGADTHSHGIEAIAAGGQVRAVDVTGEPWIDVDTAEDE